MLCFQVFVLVIWIGMGEVLSYFVQNSWLFMLLFRLSAKSKWNSLPIGVITLFGSPPIKNYCSIQVLYELLMVVDQLRILLFNVFYFHPKPLPSKNEVSPRDDSISSSSFKVASFTFFSGSFICQFFWGDFSFSLFLLLTYILLCLSSFSYGISWKVSFCSFPFLDLGGGGSLYCFQLLTDLFCCFTFLLL